VGRRVAEMQLALASRDDVPDFKPEPITPLDVSKWTQDVLRRAQRAFGKLERHRAGTKPAERSLIDQILAQEALLPAHLRGLLPESIDAVKIRHHGDFHLGQMLIVKDDVVILDFEGEPRRSLAERRRKAPAARDVAGLIRSIDYSATAALERALKSAPDEHGKIARALDDWREHSVAAVLAAYREFALDARLWPAAAGDADRLLDFFLLEKVCYELEYEMAHRPDWLRVPLAGLARILARSRVPS
jgi:maltose alpha-D-glucosyltransferase / alpha-amylase